MIKRKKRMFFLSALAIFIIWSTASYLYAQGTKTEAEELAEKIAQQKRIQEQERKMLVEGHTVKGIVLYKEGEYYQALDEFLLAQKLNPYNKEVATYIEKCKEKINNLANKHFLKGVKLYNRGELIKAASEFSLVPEISSKYKESQDYLVKIEEELKTTVPQEEIVTVKPPQKSTKEEIEERLKELKEQQAIAQLRKQAQEQAMMLEVEKAYYPPPKVKRKEEVEVETPEEKKEREEAQARAKVIEQMKNITVPALSLTDADIRDVIRQLMNMTGVTIVLDEAALAKVAGEGTVRVTFTTVNPMPLLDLLELSLKATALSYRVEPTYIWISDKETLAKEELVTKTYRLKYGVRKIREVSLSEFGTKESEEEY
jgi:hypothetical protein